MPVHDWTTLGAWAFHDFHLAWIAELQKVLNRGLLPDDYYAMAEQQAAGFGPDVLTLQDTQADAVGGGAATVTQTKPKTTHYAQTTAEFHRRQKSSIVVRHVSGDRIVAMIEIVSPGNKSSRAALSSAPCPIRPNDAPWNAAERLARRAFCAA